MVPITGAVKPRIGILLATLALALLIAPAQASAASSFCGAGIGPFAATDVALTVRKRSGGRWVSYAAATAKL